MTYSDRGWGLICPELKQVVTTKADHVPKLLKWGCSHMNEFHNYQLSFFSNQSKVLIHISHESSLICNISSLISHLSVDSHLSLVIVHPSWVISHISSANVISNLSSVISLLKSSICHLSSLYVLCQPRYVIFHQS